MSLAFTDPTMEEGSNSQALSGHSYDVFLSFRGPDTRYQFTDCLYNNLEEAGIIIYRDTESLPVGKKIRELLPAIEDSKIYIPIFSKTYASSPWCLRELAHMVECTSKSNENKEILPIFLDVEPDVVKLRTNELEPNLYRQALSEHQKEFSAEVKSWEKALIEVGKIRGWNWQEQEHKGQGDLIRSVRRTVLVKLKVIYENVTKDLVGVEDRVEAIIKKLDLKSDRVQFLRIYGIGGIGKTTLAKVVFNQLLSSFHHCCFLADVGELSRRHGVVYLQKQLLKELLDSHSSDQIYRENCVINMITRGVLRNKKILIVLDDVDEEEQLRNLADRGDWFGSGSRIIITTRYRDILKIEGEASSEGLVKKSAKILTYEVEVMQEHHALKLFSRYAFRRDYPPNHCVSLSKNIVHILGKLPLALEVVGSSLNGKPEDFWKETLKKLQDAPHKRVRSALMITYQRLDNAQREVFMDIACFFIGVDKTYPFYMWDALGYYPRNAIDALYLMSLIKIKDNTFWMHDQVRIFGRDIVCEENFKYPYERSRVWHPENAMTILKRKEVNTKIEALSLGFHAGILKHDQFANLQNLRFFQGDGVFFEGNFNNLLSSLKWLSWRHCPSEFMATNFHPTNLVVLDISWSDITEAWIGWNYIRGASKLKVLDLSNCKYLTRTPDLSKLVSLERLILEDCCNLIEIDPSIEIVMPDILDKFILPETFGKLKSLLTLDVSQRQISKLPFSIGGLVELTRLNLYQCTKIKELPDSVGKLQSLVELDLSWTSIGHLPDSIGDLKQLKVLRMSHIIGITKLPRVIGLMEKLEELDVSDCWNLVGEIPEEIGSLSCLKVLDLSDTHICGLPNSIGSLKQLRVLRMSHIRGITKLPSAIGLVEKLEELNARGCHSLTGEIFEEIGKLSCLRILDLSDTHICGLPHSIGNLKQLRVLRMSHIRGITKLPSAIGLVEKLEELNARGYQNLTGEIPEEIGKLSCLRILDLSDTLVSGLPTTVSHLSNLQTLSLESCPRIKQLPVLPSSLTCLR
ncbi:disease resistance protein RPV1-like isoform X2 [Eucalyptus grandis]|uniref:disease resistance protein RPV1-like isoform X2 n=1 Tax=Eucalyptus grandis TaxID=71139 RepID=UPI00192EEE03|nr:disease resistance protein RPV1-like isoform X2 [Eucalyptus grandis]